MDGLRPPTCLVRDQYLSCTHARCFAGISEQKGQNERQCRIHLAGLHQALKKLPLCQCDRPYVHFGTPVRKGRKRGGLMVASRDRGRRNDRPLTIHLVCAITPSCAAELHHDTLPKSLRANFIALLFAVACHDGLEQGKLQVRLAPYGISPASAPKAGCWCVISMTMAAFRAGRWNAPEVYRAGRVVGQQPVGMDRGNNLLNDFSI